MLTLFLNTLTIFVWGAGPVTIWKWAGEDFGSDLAFVCWLGGDTVSPDIFKYHTVYQIKIS